MKRRLWEAEIEIIRKKTEGWQWWEGMMIHYISEKLVE